SRQAAIRFGISDVVQHIDNASPTNARGIIDTGVVETTLLTKLTRPALSHSLHIVLRSEAQTPRWASLNAGRLQSLTDAVRAQRALEHLLCLRIKLGNIEGATAHAVTAADAVFLLKIHDAVAILHDRAVGRTSGQATRLHAVHALVFA